MPTSGLFVINKMFHFQSKIFLKSKLIKTLNKRLDQFCHRFPDSDKRLSLQLSDWQLLATITVLRPVQPWLLIQTCLLSSCTLEKC